MTVSKNQPFEKVLEDFADGETGPVFRFVHDTLSVADQIVRSVTHTEKPDFDHVLAVYDRIAARIELLEAEDVYASFGDDDDDEWDEDFDGETASR